MRANGHVRQRRPQHVSRSARQPQWARGRPKCDDTVLNAPDYKSLQRQLHHAQRFEYIGHFAGGIGHELNNLLTVILGCACEVQKHMGDRDLCRLCRLDIGEIQKAGRRATELTHQLLSWVRRSDRHAVALDLNAIVADLASVLRRIIGENIEVIVQLEPGLRLVNAEPEQVEQILMNLVTNARDAMPDGGTLTIVTRNVDDNQHDAGATDSQRGVAYVLVAVSDTGEGIDAAVLAHIFEPFFTTKPFGKGTGLGLSTVADIVKQAGGRILVHSERHQGTRFEIYLPQAESDRAAA